MAEDYKFKFAKNSDASEVLEPHETHHMVDNEDHYGREDFESWMNEQAELQMMEFE